MRIFPPDHKNPIFMSSITYEDIRLFWSRRVETLRNWLEKEAGRSKQAQFPILMPDHEVSLNVNPNDTQSLANYLIESRERAGRRHIIFLPLKLENRWISLILFLNEKNHILGAAVTDTVLSETVVDDCLQKMGLHFSDEPYYEKSYLLSEACQKPENKEISFEQILNFPALKNQLQRADPLFKDPIHLYCSHFSEEETASGFLCMENAMELIKMLCLGGRNYKIRPTWLSEGAIAALEAKYRTLPGIRIHPKLKFSSKNLLPPIWESIDTKIIDYLQQRLAKHRDLFLKNGGLTSAEKMHLSCFLESLDQMRVELKQSQKIFSELESQERRNTFIVNEITVIKCKLQWFDSVLKNLTLTGEETRYFVMPKDAIGSLKDGALKPSALKKRSLAVEKQNNVLGNTFFEDLTQLFSDCHQFISPTLEQLNRDSEHVEALVLAQQRPHQKGGSKEAVIAALSDDTATVYGRVGVERNATKDEIDRTFRKRSIHVHSDKGGQDDLMKKLSDARDILLDPNKKVALDKKLDLIEALEEDDTTIEDFFKSNEAPLSDFYKAQQAQLMAFYQEKPLTNFPQGFIATASSARTYFKPIQVSNARYPRPKPPRVKRPVKVKKQRSIQRERIVPKGMREIEFNAMLTLFCCFMFSPLAFWDFSSFSCLIAFREAGETEETRLKNKEALKLLLGLMTLGSFLVLLNYAFRPPTRTTVTEMEDYFDTEIQLVDGPVDNKEAPNDIYTFIRESTSVTALNTIEFTGHLTPKKSVNLLQRFLKGDFTAKNLITLRNYFADELKGLSRSEDYGLYSAIFEIISREAISCPRSQVISRSKVDAQPLLLFSLQKILDYAKKSPAKTMPILIPLLENPYFRLLFSQALHDYWTTPFSIFDVPAIFDGREKSIQRITDLIESNTFNTASEHEIQRLTLTQQFDTLLYASDGPRSAATGATHYREKANLCIDGIRVLRNVLNPLMHVNLIIQAGVYFQCASHCDAHKTEQMADQKLALEMYSAAITIGEKQSPNITLYVYFQTLRYMAAFRYDDPALSEMIAGFQHRALRLADLFPIFYASRPNIDLLEPGACALQIFQELLMSYIDRLETTPHDKITVLYTAYEACIRGWYPNYGQPELPEQFRQQLISRLLASKKWTDEEVNRSLNFPWVMIDRDASGWVEQPRSGLSLPNHPAIELLQSLKGMEINHETGEINFLVTPWHRHDHLYKRRFTNLDLSEILEKSIGCAEFSLDDVDPDLPYHPFNNMRFSPSTLHGTELLSTMFLTDYLLKFFTVGYQPEGKPPYAMKSIDALIQHLPAHLKKIITDFHQNQSKEEEESAHRFWIETTGFPVAFPDEGRGNQNTQRILLGKLNMVVKKHRLMRNAEGKLIDDPREKDEGWPLYVIDASTLSEWKKKPSTQPKHAMVFIAEKDKVYFFKGGEPLAPVTLKKQSANLRTLFQLKREKSGEVIRDLTNAYFLLNFTREIAAAANQPDYFTAEYVFAQEFTAHYDEFARYFPEFGRLKALSRATALVPYLNGIRKRNETEIKSLQERLNNPDHDDWMLIRAEGLLAEFSEHWKNSLLFRYDRVAIDLHRKDFISFNEKAEKKAWNPDTQELYAQKRSEYFKKHGVLGYFNLDFPKTADVIRKAMEPILERLILQKVSRLQGKARETFKRQLIENYVSTLAHSHWSKEEATQCIEAYLQGDRLPLSFALKVVENDEPKAVREFQRRFGIVFNSDERHLLLSGLLGNETKKIQLGRSISAHAPHLVRAWHEQAEKHKVTLRARLSTLLKLQESLNAIGLGKNTPEKNLKDQCSWVPASVNKGLSGNRSRFVYGGVALIPKPQEYWGADPTAQAMARKAASQPNITRMSASELHQKQRQASSQLPTGAQTTNVSQQYRFFQAEQARRRGASSSTNTSRGTGQGVKSSGGGAAASGGSGGGRRPPSGWTITARLKAAQLPNEGKIRFIPPKGYTPSEPLRKDFSGGYKDKFGNVWRKGPSRTIGQPFEWDVQLSDLGHKKLGWASRDGSHLNVSLDGHITHR